MKLLQKIHVWVITVTLWFRDADLSACSWLFWQSLIYNICSFFLVLLTFVWASACANGAQFARNITYLREAGGWRVWEWVETVIFSSGPEGSPSLYKALWAAQESNSSYELEEQRQQAAAARCSHQGIIRTVLLCAEETQTVQQLDTLWPTG